MTAFHRRAAASIALGVLTGCGAGGDAAAGGAGGEGGDARSAIRIVVVTHGQASDPFWSIVANGVSDAAEELGVRAEYQAPTSFDMVRMNQLLEAAVASRPSGLIVSVPDPDALGGAIRAAVDAGIPILSINTGAESWRELGLLAHIGQTEYEAGYAAGERLARAGARRVLCVNHEVGNLALDARCRGLGDAIEAAGGSIRTLAVDLANPADAQQRVSGALASGEPVDGILTLGPGGAVPALHALRSGGYLGRTLFGTFDLDAQILEAVAAGDVLFAIDQQPYLQGYLGVVSMVKYLETGAIAGGGQIIRTGPAFVTRENAADVIELAAQGIR